MNLSACALRAAATISSMLPKKQNTMASKGTGGV